MAFTDSRKPLKGAWLFACTVCLLAACAPKRVPPIVYKDREDLPIIDSTYLSANIYFKNCDSVRAFLDWVVVNNREDKTLSRGRFKYRYFQATYKHLSKMLPDSCFIGMHARDFIRIFGDLDPGKLDSFTLLSISSDKQGGVGIEAYFKDSLITRFSARQCGHVISVSCSKN